MSAALDDETLEEIKARRDQVMQLMFRLSEDADKNFRMSIPPQSDDSDMLLMALCADVDRLLTAVRRGGEDTARSQDVRIVAEFLVGYWPGLEDGISWGGDVDEHPAHRAAERILAASHTPETTP